ncbi:sensor histidine kinase [Leifsonia xyli]|uniref:sensor histidine kinase n=1 Tax=Leifsonia xyli TaxID=1575 RepID=UPI000693FD3B|nr:HAMP domain-containing sensor histidine kinase [Leifsonia xyli]
MLADRIDSTLERLDAAFARQERFLGNASHELRTPLTQGRFAPEVEPSVRRAIRSYLRMEEAVEGLLQVARVGELGEADVEAVPLAEVLARTAGDIEGEARERGVRVREGVRPDLAVCGYAPAVDVAVRNILLNAVRHNVDGGFVRIDVERAAAGSAVAIRVENSGARYEAEEATRLLEPFNRGAVSRKGGAKGMGLGLSIVSAHRGSVSVVPRAGGGLVVTLTFPAAAGNADALAHGEGAPPSRGRPDQR